MGQRVRFWLIALVVLVCFPQESFAAERTLIGYASPMTVRPSTCLSESG